MNATTKQPTRNYFDAVLARYTNARNEFLTAYEILQSESKDTVAQRQNALAALTDTDHVVRRAASRILLAHAENLGEHVDMLIARLKDYDCEVIVNLCAVLARLGGKAIKAVDALNWHVTGQNAALRMVAQKTMVAIVDDFGQGLCAGMVGRKTVLVRKF